MERVGLLLEYWPPPCNELVVSRLRGTFMALLDLPPRGWTLRIPKPGTDPFQMLQAIPFSHTSVVIRLHSALPAVSSPGLRQDGFDSTSLSLIVSALLKPVSLSPLCLSGPLSGLQQSLLPGQPSCLTLGFLPACSVGFPKATTFLDLDSFGFSFACPCAKIIAKISCTLKLFGSPSSTWESPAMACRWLWMLMTEAELRREQEADFRLIALCCRGPGIAGASYFRHLMDGQQRTSGPRLRTFFLGITQLKRFLKLWVYGKDLFISGKSYGCFSETINAVPARRPARQLASAWDLKFLPGSWWTTWTSCCYATFSRPCTDSFVSLLYGWSREAELILLGWTGALRAGELFGAARDGLVLPCKMLSQGFCTHFWRYASQRHGGGLHAIKRFTHWLQFIEDSEYVRRKEKGGFRRRFLRCTCRRPHAVATFTSKLSSGTKSRIDGLRKNFSRILEKTIKASFIPEAAWPTLWWCRGCWERWP